MGLLTSEGETAPDDMADGDIWSGIINPDWQKGSLFTDEQLAAIRSNPDMWALGLGDLTQPIPQFPGSIDGGPVEPIPMFGPGGPYRDAVWQPGTGQAGGGPVPIADMPPPAPDNASQSAMPQDSVSADNASASQQPGGDGAASAQAPAEAQPEAGADAGGPGKDGSANDSHVGQPNLFDRPPVTFEQIEPQLQAQIQGIPMPQVPNPQPTAESIDEYLRSKNSPLAGQGANFVKYGQKYDLDPRLMVAIAGAETGFGKNITAGQNNAFNLLYNHQTPHDSDFDNWEHAINSLGVNLTNPKHDYHLSDTTSMYKGVRPGNGYCSGKGCDAGLANLDTFLREQGGDPNALHYLVQ